MPETIIKHAQRSDATFLIGRNGSGKSFKLAQIAHSLVSEGKNVIAISNAVQTRFPRHSDLKSTHYHRYAPTGLQNTKPTKLLASLLRQPNTHPKWLESVARLLQYLDFDDTLEFYIRSLESPQYNPWYSADYNDLQNRTTYRKFQQAAAKVGNSLSRSSVEDISLIPAINAVTRNDYLRTKISLHEFHNIEDIAVLESLTLLVKRLGNFRLGVLLNKRGERLDADSLSSGETSLISNHVFINQHLTGQDYILIDEPENSLHPQWQQEYCDNIFNLNPYRRIHLIIATHSALVISGALIANLRCNVFTAPYHNPISGLESKGVDGILMEAFGTITPKNHYLSIKATSLLENVSQRTLSIQTAINTIHQWKSNTSDPKQKEFLDDLIDLTIKVSRESAK